jgi:hypothetical protein
MDLGHTRHPLRNARDFRANRAQHPSAMTFMAALQSKVGVGLLVSTLLGYPLVAVIATIARIDNSTLSIPYRGVVLAISIFLLLSAVFSKFRGRFDTYYGLFAFAYFARLVYDYTYQGLPGTENAIMTTFSMIPALALASVSVNDFDEVALAKIIFCFGLLIVVLSIFAEYAGLGYNPWAFYDGRLKVRLAFEGLNPISLSYVAVTTLLAALIIVVSPGVSKIWRPVAAFGVAASGYLMIQGASRGALVGLIVCILFFSLSKTKYLFIVSPIIILALGFGITQTDVFDSLLGVANGGWETDLSGLERLQAQQLAIADFFESPLFGKNFISSGLIEGEYPHNIIIETAMALGVCGLALFLIMGARVYANVRQGFGKYHPLILLLFLQYFVNAQFSGALIGFGQLYALLALVLQPVQLTAKKVIGDELNYSPVRRRTFHSIRP